MCFLEELQAQAGARVGQAPLQMDVAALRLRQGCGATGRGRAHSAKGRFRGVSILVEAISYVCGGPCGRPPGGRGGRFFDRINRIYGICRMNRTEKINS